MASYTFVSSSKLKNIETNSTYKLELAHTFSSSSFLKMKPFKLTYSVEVENAQVPSVSVTMIDNFNLKLVFNPTMRYAKFVLNNVIISEMSIVEDEHIYNLNPAMLLAGENVLHIYVYDNDDAEHLRVFKLNKALSTPNVSVGDVLHLKGKRYTISNVNAETVTLNETLIDNVPINTFAEKPLFNTVAYANLGFYKDAVISLPMNFNKATFKDGRIEEMHELENVLGDVLHTKLEVVRNNTNQEINISNIEFITIPVDEV